LKLGEGGGCDETIGGGKISAKLSGEIKGTKFIILSLFLDSGG